MALGVIWADGLWDEAIWDNSIWSQSTPVDTIPDDDDFTAQTNLALSASVDSNVITLTGMATTAQCVVSGGTMSVDGDGFSGTARNVTANGTIQIRLTTSASDLTESTATITINGIVFSFSATTGEGAATLSSPSVNPSATSATYTVTTDKQTGILYWVVTQSATQPSIAQIKAGQDNLGAGADSAGTTPVLAVGAVAATGGGLTADTSGYFFHAVHTTTVDSNRLSSTTFATVAAGTVNKSSFMVNNWFGVRF